MKTRGEIINTKIVSSGSKQILQVALKDVNTIDYQIEMINRNETNTLVNLEKFVFNNEIQLNYEVTGLLSITDYLKSNVLSKDKLLAQLKEISEIILESENYFLNSNNFLLKSDNIFVDESTLKIKLIYMPLEISITRDINDDFRALAKTIIADLAVIEETYGDNYMQVLLNTTKKYDLTVKEFKEIIISLQNNNISNNINAANNIKPTVNTNITKHETIQQSNIIEQKPISTTNYNSQKHDTIQNNTNLLQQTPNNSYQKNINVDYNNNNQNSNTTNTHQQDTKANHSNSVNNNEQNVYKIDNKKKSTTQQVEQVQVKEVFATWRIIVLIILQPIFIGAVIGIVFLGSSLDLTQKGIGSMAIVIVDILALRILLNKDKKIKVKVKVKGNQAVESTNVKNDTKKTQKKKAKNQKNNIKDTTDINPSVNLQKKEMMSQLSYDTEVLDLSNPYFLISTGGIAEKININKDIYTLGRIPNMADYAINSNAVGKIHAQVSKNGSSYVLQDLNSKNGTFVNGQRLSPNSEVVLVDNDEVKLANVIMIFKLA